MSQKQAFIPRDDAPVTASKDARPARALVGEAVTIDRPAQELFDFWRDQTRLVEVMENVVSIERLADDRFRWTVKAPMGREVSWESLITHEVAGEEISWQSADGAEIDNSGKISFLDAGERGTLVRVRIAYDAPGGAVGQLVAKLFQREPRIQARRDLHRFKQLMEAGEIATSARNRRQRDERDEAQGLTEARA
jgi:uncharacterized membrane protein